MEVLELDKLRIEIEILRQIISYDKDDTIFIRKRELQKFLEDKQHEFYRLITIYENLHKA